MAIWLVENQLQFKMTSEPEGWIIGSDSGLRAFTTYWINGLKMIVTKDVNKTNILMGLTIMQASKNFKSNRLLRIFGRSNSISKTFVKHMNNSWWADPWYVRGIIRRGINAEKRCKAVGTKDSRNIGEFFRVSSNNKGNWERRYGRQV